MDIVSKPWTNSRRGQTYGGVPGEKHNLLTLIERVGTRRSKALWSASCDCGNTTTVTISDLRSGNTKSCGCQKGEGGRRSLTTHGNSSHPEYELWREMKRRCKDRPNYYNKGVVVCPAWESFEQFCLDMGPRPFPTSTIERVNNNGNYEPSNCVWASKYEQARNKSTNVFVNLLGRRYILADALAALGKHHNTVHKRMKLSGETHQQIIDALAEEVFGGNQTSV